MEPGNRRSLTRQGSVVSRSGGDGDSRSGMVRSKSMINPPSIAPARRAGSSSANQIHLNSGRKQCDTKLLNKQQRNNKNIESSNKNFVSLPDVSVHRKRNSTVDEGMF